MKETLTFDQGVESFHAPETGAEEKEKIKGKDKLAEYAELNKKYERLEAAIAQDKELKAIHDKIVQKETEFINLMTESMTKIVTGYCEKNCYEKIDFFVNGFLDQLDIIINPNTKYEKSDYKKETNPTVKEERKKLTRETQSVVDRCYKELVQIVKTFDIDKMVPVADLSREKRQLYLDDLAKEAADTIEKMDKILEKLRGWNVIINNKFFPSQPKKPSLEELAKKGDHNKILSEYDKLSF